jgi:trehalose 6-phosphate phosphatase
MEPLAVVEGQILRRLRAAERVFCFLDYDGTLAPLAPTPDRARPLAGTAGLLGALAAMRGTRVAVVSGRPIADLRRFLDVPGVYYVGLHGLEVCMPGGTTELTEDVARVEAVMPEIWTALEEALGGLPGVLIENKGTALACHYRLASATDALAVLHSVAAVVDAYDRKGVPIRITHGHEVAEIRPAGVNKGKTVCRLLAAYGPSALAVYIGDDQTDEDAFALLPPDSITIQVGRATVPTRARYRLEGLAEVRRFLEAMFEHGRRGERAAIGASEG